MSWRRTGGRELRSSGPNVSDCKEELNDETNISDVTLPVKQ